MAKRFTFRLETVLTLRQRHEDQQRRVVAECARDVGRSREVLADLQGAVADALAGARVDRAGVSIDASTAMQEEQWRGHLKRRIAERVAQIKRLESQLDIERGELARRATERKAIETLRERRLKAYLACAARQERFADDEVAARVSVRHGRGPGRPRGLKSPAHELIGGDGDY